VSPKKRSIFLVYLLLDSQIHNIHLYVSIYARGLLLSHSHIHTDVPTPFGIRESVSPAEFSL